MIFGCVWKWAVYPPENGPFSIYQGTWWWTSGWNRLPSFQTNPNGGSPKWLPIFNGESNGFGLLHFSQPPLQEVERVPLGGSRMGAEDFRSQLDPPKHGATAETAGLQWEVLLSLGSAWQVLISWAREDLVTKHQKNGGCNRNAWPARRG